jgi:hypothetical protein
MADRQKMLELLNTFTTENGFPARRELLQKHAGVTAPSDVPDDKVEAVTRALERRAKTPSTLDDIQSAAYAKWNSARAPEA